MRLIFRIQNLNNLFFSGVVVERIEGGEENSLENMGGEVTRTISVPKKLREFTKMRHLEGFIKHNIFIWD